VQNKRLERTRHQHPSLLSCVGEPLKRSVRWLLLFMGMNMTNKVCSILFLVTLFSIPVSSETVMPPVETTLYFRALQAGLEENAKAYSNLNIGRDLHTVIVERNIQINQDFPRQIQSFKIEYLDTQDLIAKYKKEKKEFRIIVMRPILNEGEKLSVGLTDYWFSFKKNSLTYSLEGGAKVVFRFDCEHREYVIDKVELWGV
jgi:hypothetical protein